MSLATYGDLKTSLGNWLNRADLTAVIPDFVRLAEATIARDVRRATVRATLTLDAQTVALPAACGELRSIAVNIGTRAAPLEIITPDALYEITGTGVPVRAAIVGGSLVLSPAPDQPYVADITYFAKLVPLAADSDSNALLVEAPDLYLFGALAASAPFLQHDERLATWAQLYGNAVEGINRKREAEEYAGGLKRVRLPVVFG